MSSYGNTARMAEANNHNLVTGYVTTATFVQIGRTIHHLKERARVTFLQLQSGSLRALVRPEQQTIEAVGFNSLFGGLFKSVVYGSLVALAGCQQGLACGSSAMAVGQSTTRAVVMGIVLIVVSAAVLTVIYINLGI